MDIRKVACTLAWPTALVIAAIAPASAQKPFADVG